MFSKIAKPPSITEKLFDRSFRVITFSAALTIIMLALFIIYLIASNAWPAITQYHFHFLVDSAWNVQTQTFGILPEIWGTLYSSVLALVISSFVGINIAILLTQNFLSEQFAIVFRTIIEILASVPSVVFGLWGIFVVIPAIRPVANWLHTNFSFLGIFSTPFNGPSLFTSSIVLSIMVLPTIAAISQDTLRMISPKTREAAYGLGATRFEVITKVMLPTASGGLASAIILGFGRALGETMALAMLIGNSSRLSISVFSPADTLASLLASHFPEAGEIEIHALLYAALVLMTLTIFVNVVGQIVLRFSSKKFEGVK
jgi:phosphate transport system permease protein